MGRSHSKCQRRSPAPEERKEPPPAYTDILPRPSSPIPIPTRSGVVVPTIRKRADDDKKTFTMIFTREIDIAGSEPTPELEIRPVLIPSGKCKTYRMDVHLVFNIRQTGDYFATARTTPVLNLAHCRSTTGDKPRLVVNVYRELKRAEGCAEGVLPTVDCDVNPTEYVGHEGKPNFSVHVNTRI